MVVGPPAARTRTRTWQARTVISQPSERRGGCAAHVFPNQPTSQPRVAPAPGVLMEARKNIGNGATLPASTGRRPRLAPIVAVLVLAMSGTAGALAGRNSVDSGDIRNGQVKSKDIRAGAVRTATSPTGGDLAEDRQRRGPHSRHRQRGGDLGEDRRRRRQLRRRSSMGRSPRPRSPTAASAAPTSSTTRSPRPTSRTAASPARTSSTARFPQPIWARTPSPPARSPLARSVRARSALRGGRRRDRDGAVGSSELGTEPSARTRLPPGPSAPQRSPTTR